jgi:hypothetical protein
MDENDPSDELQKRDEDLLYPSRSTVADGGNPTRQYGSHIIGDALDRLDPAKTAAKGMVDSYCDQDWGCHVWLKIVSDGKAEQFVAVFECATVVDDVKIDDRGSRLVGEDASIRTERVNSYRVYKSVPVLSRQSMEAPEPLIPSVVRLYRFDSLPVMVGKVLYPVLVPEHLTVIEDGKLNSLRSDRQSWVLAENEQRYLVRQIVQRTPEVVEHRPDKSGDWVEPLGFHQWIDQAAEDRIPPLTLRLYPRRISVGVSKAVQQTVKGLAIVLRPIKADPGVPETGTIAHDSILLPRDARRTGP